MQDKQYRSRMGDGAIVYMTEAEILAEIVSGTEDAARRGKIPTLTEEEQQKIFEIVTMEGNTVSVKAEETVVTTSDSGSIKIKLLCDIPLDSPVGAQVHERVLCCDSVDVGFQDYNYKTVKGVAKRQAAELKSALQNTTFPIYYSAMPNLGFYTKPDGPIENWAVLIPEGKIEEGRAAQEQAVEHAVKDILYAADQMHDVGADGIQFDTCGAAGDADFLTGLIATEQIRKKYPDMPVILGMAGEFVLGMHGKLEYRGERLAGLYPHKQVKLAEKAGASIFGAVVNTNCNKSFPWNIARVCTFIKACTEAAEIPVHADVGMGVCGIPMCETAPPDIVSRVDKCLIEICKIDGL